MTTAEKKIVQARVAMLFDHPFFGNLAMFLEVAEKPEMFPPTMATDGRHLYYHPDFISKTSLEELTGVIAHEVGHVALLHPPRRHNRNEIRWNIACDYAVNDLVLKEFKLPEGVLCSPAYADKSAEWIYERLPEMCGGEKGKGTLDSHGEWADWGLGEGEEQGKSSQNRLEGSLEQEWRERVAQAASQARMQGKLPGHLETLVDGILQPKLDWKTILRDMITSCAKSDFQLVPPNKKHMWRGLYLPSLTGEEISIGVGIDSSGSISDKEVRDFLSELKGICDSYENYTVYLFVADTHIRQRFELHPFDPLPDTITGRGGTSFIEPLEEAARLPISSFVYMTDLCGAFPEQEPAFPVIWVAVGDGEAPWGKIIRLPEGGDK